MDNKEIYNYLDQIGCLTFSTYNKCEIHSRIAHFFAFDESGFYFRTMNTKAFYKHIKNNSKIAICGMYPSTQVMHHKSGLPNFLPGYTIRITGKARELTQAEIITKVKNNKDFEVLTYDQEKYPATKGLVIYEGKGEIFDYDFAKENREHKLMRKRFSFGEAKYNEAGVRISKACVACGKCEKVCSFGAVIKGKTSYKILGERCDECGNCIQVCPKNAIKLPKQF